MPTSYTWPLVSVSSGPTPPGGGTPIPVSLSGISAALYAQILQLFPASWLPPAIQASPPTGVLAALFAAMATNLGYAGGMVVSSISSVPSTLKAQLRLQTMSGSPMDIYAADFYGTGLPRYPGETDAHYQNRIRCGIFVSRLTRPAIFAMLWQLTGIKPRMLEPWRPSDTGGLTKTTGTGTFVGGKWVYALAANMPASYIGVDTAAAPLRLMNPGGLYGVNPGYGWQAFVDTTYPAGFGAQGNTADAMMTVTGSSSPPTEYGGIGSIGSPSVYTNLSGGGFMACPNASGATADRGHVSGVAYHRFQSPSPRRDATA